MRIPFMVVFVFFSIVVFSQEIPSKDAIDDTFANSTAKKITGTITDVSGAPLFGVNVIVKGTNKATKTDFNGYYTINVNKGDVLVFSFIGLQTQEEISEGMTVLNVVLDEDTEILKEVVVNAEKNIRKKRAESYATYEITQQQINKMGYYEKLSQFFGDIGAVRVRGQTSMFSSDVPLYVIDGIPVNNRGPIDDLININDIESVKIIRGVSGFYRYGERALGGAIEITTKRKLGAKNRMGSNTVANLYKGSLKVEESILDEPYIKELSIAHSAEEAYNIYLKQKEQYGHLPAYYLNIYNYFKKWKDRNYELRILFNDVITDLDNPEQLKALAYLLEAAKEYKLAINIYNQILRLLPADLQSFRDLALIYKNIGLEQESTAILSSLISDENNDNEGALEFSDIDDILLNDGLNVSYDLRIVADWNRYDANINLQVIDPSRETCNYENPKTKQGGQLAQNMSQGYGPEEFILKNAKKGSYFVMVNYSLRDTEETTKPTYIKLTMFKDYGKPTETREIKVLQLTEPQDGLVIAKLEF
ncbi:carboxypeptidase-like regulatory domain-containing protein [Confluentibacter lentus]|uniref:carboxypeptidase-like regulatory domain-containing protein n=1 Tax=Confluentibacter lentus TaxID=1699412 RepID=UPI000C28B6C6|nr:carboxypeptidase-like regulatory domain-containing protein [Confluentibacter lentus]